MENKHLCGLQRCVKLLQTTYAIRNSCFGAGLPAGLSCFPLWSDTASHGKIKPRNWWLWQNTWLTAGKHGFTHCGRRDRECFSFNVFCPVLGEKLSLLPCRCSRIPWWPHHPVTSGVSSHRSMKSPWKSPNQADAAKSETDSLWFGCKITASS